ncbi:MAG: RdgB/HAM1 family non-canonical purine NTP pyrophosphatase [Promethearchaeota archaeon]|nr:MAG: RdgB/HAM1 family non-canonical purine NTP pyrophosphatase [Candidatus Lokiarchaeota archaeon]
MQIENLILYFVTGNKSKFNEVLKIFHTQKVKVTLQQLNIETVEIQADNIEDVALFKLNSVKDKINRSFFIEDAGFFVDKPLKGFPGVFSSYVFKTIGNEGILRLIDDFRGSRAHFSAVIAFYFKPLDKILIFEGGVRGKVSKEMRGTKGFGFDPIFIPDLIPNKTFSELTSQEKNQISHSGQAIRKLISFLKKISKE